MADYRFKFKDLEVEDLVEDLEVEALKEGFKEGFKEVLNDTDWPKIEKITLSGPPYPGQKLQGSQIDNNNSYLQKAQFPDTIKLDTKYFREMFRAITPEFNRRGTMGNEVLAMNNGSGCTGCSACGDLKEQEKCEGFEKASFEHRCMWQKFNEYCDNPKMQGR